MLRAAFLKAELEFLKSEENFANAAQEVETLADFERLTDLAEQLLGARGRVNQSAHQFRRDSKRDQHFRPPS